MLDFEPPILTVLLPVLDDLLRLAFRASSKTQCYLYKWIFFVEETDRADKTLVCSKNKIRFMNTRPRVGTKAREHPRNALATCPSCKNIQSIFNGWGWLKCLPKNKKSGRGCQKRTVLNRMFPIKLSLGPAGRPVANLKNTHFQQLTRYASATRSCQTAGVF